MYLTIAASSENDQGSMNLASNRASVAATRPSRVAAIQRKPDADPPLNICNPLARVGLIPASVKVLGYDSELDDKVAGEILGLDLAAFFAPQPKQRILVIAHDDPGVGAADKVAAA